MKAGNHLHGSCLQHHKALKSRSLYQEVFAVFSTSQPICILFKGEQLHKVPI